MIDWNSKPGVAFADLFGMDRPLVLYAGYIGLPGTGASIEHACNVALALGIAGFRVVLLPAIDNGRAADRVSEGVFRFHGVDYIPAGDPSTDGRSSAETLKVYTGARAPVLELLRNADLTGVTAIISIDGTAGYSWRLRSLCGARKISAIAELVERHGRDTPGLALRGIRYLDMELLRLTTFAFRNILTNTRCLERCYRQHGCKVHFLPAILDTEAPRWNAPLPQRRQNPEELRLVFSGTPDRERHDLILEAVRRVRAEGHNVRLEYVGCSRERLSATLGSHRHLIDDLGDALAFHGWVSVEQLRSILASADFGVLLRADARWSRSCFPSKVPEFLSLGVPIICNLTSDLGVYLRDGNEALIVDNLSAAALAQTIRRAVGLLPAQRTCMAAHARKRAENTFDIRRHAKALGQFVHETCERARQ